MQKPISPVIPFWYQWILLLGWAALLVWAFAFSGGNRAGGEVLFNDIMTSVTLASPMKVDWTLAGLFLMLGLCSFGLLLLLLGQTPFRGGLVFKLVFFLLSVFSGSYAFMVYLIFQRAEGPRKPLSQSVTDFIGNPWGAATVLILSLAVYAAMILNGNPVVLVESILNNNFVQIMAMDFAVYWLLMIILVVGDYQENRATGAVQGWWLAALVVPVSGPMLYLLLKNLAASKDAAGR